MSPTRLKEGASSIELDNLPKTTRCKADSSQAIRNGACTNLLPDGEPEMYFYGDLDQSSLPDALAFLGREEASGVLSCQNGRIFKQVTFSGGCVVSVLSNQAEERLGQSLVRRGILSTAQVRDALRAQAGMEKKLGEVLLSLGVLDRTSLAEELVCQASTGLSSLFGWKQGQFVFQSKRVGIPPDHPVWLEAAPVVFRELLSFGSPLEDRIDAEGIVKLQRIPRTPPFHLGAEAQSVLQELRYDRNVEQLRAALGMNRVRLLRILVGLDVIGLIELPLRSDKPPIVSDLVNFYRAVVRSIFLQVDAEKGGRGVEALRSGWQSSRLGGAAVARETANASQPATGSGPEARLTEEGLLQLLDEASWNPRAEPTVLEALTTDLNDATLNILISLKERFGPPLVESLVANLSLTAKLLLRRTGQLRRLVEPVLERLFAEPATRKTSFELGIERAEAGDNAAAMRHLRDVTADHALFAKASEAMERLSRPQSPDAPKGDAAAPTAGAPGTEGATDAQESSRRAKGTAKKGRSREESSKAREIAALLEEATRFLDSGEIPAAISRCLLVMAWEPGNRRARELLDAAKTEAELASAPAKTEADVFWSEASAELEAAMEQVEGGTGSTTERLWQEDSGEIRAALAREAAERHAAETAAAAAAAGAKTDSTESRPKATRPTHHKTVPIEPGLTPSPAAGLAPAPSTPATEPPSPSVVAAAAVTTEGAIVAEPRSETPAAESHKAPAPSSGTSVADPTSPAAFGTVAPSATTTPPPAKSESPTAGAIRGSAKSPSHTELLLREAQEKIEAKDFQSALGLYKLILAVDPDHVEARRGQHLADEQMRSKDRLEGVLEQARMSEAHGRIWETITHLERLRALDPKRVEIAERLQALETQLSDEIQRSYGGPTAKPRLKLSPQRVREQDLQMDEGFLLSQIDGRTDLRTLAIITGLGVPKTYRLTLSLIDRGILEMPIPRSTGGRGRREKPGQR